jgi:hypothetical protein
MTHDKENVLTAVRGETASHPLYRAPLSTHGNGGTLCRAPPGRRTAKSGQGAWLTMPSAVRHVAGRTAKVGPWRTVDYALCRAPCH